MLVEMASLADIVEYIWPIKIKRKSLNFLCYLPGPQTCHSKSCGDGERGEEHVVCGFHAFGDDSHGINTKLCVGTDYRVVHRQNVLGHVERVVELEFGLNLKNE